MIKLSIEEIEKRLYKHTSREIGFSFKCLECGSLLTRFDNETSQEGNRVVVTFWIQCRNCNKQSILSRSTIELAKVK